LRYHRGDFREAAVLRGLFDKLLKTKPDDPAPVARADAPPAPAPAPAPVDAAERLAQARTLRAAGAFAPALTTASALLDAEPCHVEALRFVEDVAFEQGRFDQALRRYATAAAKSPATVLFHYKLGVLWEAAGDAPQAIAAYRAATRLDPAHAKAYNNLGSVLQRTGDPAGARDAFERAKAADPTLWQAHYNLGNWFKLQGRIADAVEPYQQAARLSRPVGPAREEMAEKLGGTTLSKLVHDIEQLRYLDARGLLAPEHRGAVAALEHALAALRPTLRPGMAAALPAALQGAAAPVYNRVLHVYDAPALAGPTMNPAANWRQVEDAYLDHPPGITFVDDFLTPAALAELRRFCLESTVWCNYLYQGGYLGAALEDGFICPLLAQIADELPRALPRLFGAHRLTQLWAFKYDSELTGIGEHADHAAINVNFWITPDDANLDPDSGGLVVWDKEAPLDWDFRAYNEDVAKIRRFIAESGAKPVTIPHRQNRAVIFNSDLIHKTDAFRFKPGYENRRINITLLYGDRRGHG
jgi:tetratricopeptide (TPR) repeat protein